MAFSMLRSKTILGASTLSLSSYALIKPSFAHPDQTQVNLNNQVTLKSPIINGHVIELSEVDRLSLDMNSKFEELRNQNIKIQSNIIEHQTKSLDALGGVHMLTFIGLTAMMWVTSFNHF
jgi:hypothetical protein